MSMGPEESIFDLLRPQEPQGPVKSAVRQISDTFAESLPRIMDNPDEGFGAAFGAGFLGAIAQPDREAEAARAQQREQSLKFASSVFGDLDGASRQALLDELAPGLTFKSAPAGLTQEQAFVRDLAKDMALNGKGAAQLQGFRTLSQFGLTLPPEFEAELIVEANKPAGNPLDRARQRALEIADKLENEGREPTTGEKVILNMAGANLGDRTLTPNQIRDAVLFEEFTGAFERMRTGEEPLEGDDRVLDKFLGKGTGKQLRASDAIDMIEVLDQQMFDARKAGDQDKEAILATEIEKLKRFVLQEVDAELDTDNPILDPVQQAMTVDSIFEENPELVTTEEEMVRQAVQGGFDDTPQLRKVITRHLKAKEDAQPNFFERAQGFFQNFNFNTSQADTTRSSGPFVRPITPTGE